MSARAQRTFSNLTQACLVISQKLQRIYPASDISIFDRFNLCSIRKQHLNFSFAFMFPSASGNPPALLIRTISAPQPI